MTTRTALRGGFTLLGAITLLLALLTVPAQAAPVVPPGYWFANGNVYYKTYPNVQRRVIDIQGPGTENGRIIHLWTDYGGASQRWLLDRATATGPNYKLRSRLGALEGKSKCLDLYHTRVDNGTPVHLWDCYDTNTQIWTQTALSGVKIGSYQVYMFRNWRSNTCLDAAGGGITDGTRIQIWTCNTANKNQWWY